MSISARNVFSGTVSNIIPDSINSQVELTTAGGDKIIAIVTSASVTELGLAPGKPANAYVKAPWVMVQAGQADIRFSARNHLAGSVQQVTKGAVNSEVTVKLSGGTLVSAVITNEAVLELALKPGAPAAVLFKASHVILGVPV
ncbi:MAG: TOBE domain-containing protein [Zoogloeaceae bacterium]|jgi:molybdate transport system regulatory protein|nr:TOBE domain-containing protein [Zoogloeaceae bacterium]